MYNESNLTAFGVGIRRHIKVQAGANPYLPEHAVYFMKLMYLKERKLSGAQSAREQRKRVMH